MEKEKTVVSLYKDIRVYTAEAKKSSEPDYYKLWNSCIIKPQWDKWAAGQFNEERIRMEMGRPMTDMEKLEASVLLLEEAEVENLVREAYQKALEELSAEDEAVICIMVNDKLGEETHGVVGSCVGDNMLLQINPFVEGWSRYLPWVIAHEHTHSVWGYDYFFVKRNMSMDLLTSLISEGMADSFGKHLNPALEPAWVKALDRAEEALQWRSMKKHLYQPDAPELHNKFFFGCKETDTPAFTGYTIGYNIVQSYLKNHPDTSFAELIGMIPDDILKGSGYGNDKTEQ